MTNVDLEQVRAAVETLRYVKTKITELAAIEKTARAAIEAVMTPGQVGYLDGEAVINWSTYKSNTFDQAAFKADHPELLEQYKSVKEKTKFDVL